MNTLALPVKVGVDKTTVLSSKLNAIRNDGLVVSLNLNLLDGCIRFRTNKPRENLVRHSVERHGGGLDSVIDATCKERDAKKRENRWSAHDA